MRGIILAGGEGTRLSPLTNSINKHLLPIYKKPMLLYPLETLQKANIKDIMIVLGDKGSHDVVKLVGDGSEFGFKNVYYAFQKKADGIAGALKLTKEFAGNERIAVILGDNIFQNRHVSPIIYNYGREDKARAKIITFLHPKPENFGVLVCDNKDKPIKIVEKPKKPISNRIVTGLYLYPPNVFNIIDGLKPSKRGELEITDVNNVYLKKRKLDYESTSFWVDCGESIDDYYKATYKVKDLFSGKYKLDV